MVCVHVFDGSRPILLVVRDEETSWQFLCGADDVESDSCHSVGVGHLLSRDASLSGMASLPVGFYAERSTASTEWSVGGLDT